MAAAAATRRLPLPDAHTRTLRGHKGPVHRVRFNADGMYCMTAGHDRSIKLWNPHRDSDLEPGTGNGLLIKTGHDNNKFASCGGDRAGFLWDVATGKMIRKYHGHQGRVNAVAFNEESTVLLTGSYDQTVRAWDCRSFSRTPIQVLKHFKDSISSILCTADNIIVGAIDGCVRTFDLRAGRLRMDDIHDPVVSVALSHDSNCLLAGCMQGSASARLVLLERESGDALNEYRGHKNETYQVDCTFTHTDAYIAAASEDGTIAFWDLVEGGDPVHVLKGHKKPVSSISFHKSKPTMLSASHDGTVRLWERSGL